MYDSVETLKILESTIPLGIFHVDASGKIIYANAVWEKLTGISAKEATSDTWNEIIHPVDFKKVEDEVKVALEGDGEYEFIYRIKNAKDGQYYTIISKGKFIREDDDKIEWIGYIVDITESIKKDNIIKNSEKQFEGILETISDIIIIHKDLKIIYTNKAGELVTEYSIAEITQMELTDFIPARFKRMVIGLVAAINKENSGDQIQFPLMSKSGKMIWVMPRSKMISYNGLDCIATLLVDVTNRIKNENKLKEAKKLAEETAQLKTNFINTLSHEIRTPLNGVIGMAKLLESSNDISEQKENINALIFSADHLLNLVNDILEFSKLNSKSIEINFQDCDLRQIVYQIGRLYSEKAKDNQNQLFFEFIGEVPSIIQSDPFRISQVIGNLLSNAIKFTEKGNIRLRVENTAIDNNPMIKFEVIDTGIGISMSNQAQIFEEFKQADAHTARKYGGTGLGLSICKKIADSMNGQLIVESKEGVGSTFTFIIPCPQLIDNNKNQTPNKTNMLESTTNDHLELSGKNILIVEDNHINSLVASKFLSKWGANPFIAKSGQEALEMVGNNSYDLILMDIQMPDMDGYTTSTLLRERGCKVPIIALSADSLSYIKDRMLKAGMDDYIPKPLNTQGLKEKLLAYLSEKERT